jgi:hypothetical protein
MPLFFFFVCCFSAAVTYAQQDYTGHVNILCVRFWTLWHMDTNVDFSYGTQNGGNMFPGVVAGESLQGM